MDNPHFLFADFQQNDELQNALTGFLAPAAALNSNGLLSGSACRLSHSSWLPVNACSTRTLTPPHIPCRLLCSAAPDAQALAEIFLGLTDHDDGDTFADATAASWSAKTCCGLPSRFKPLRARSWELARCMSMQGQLLQDV